MCTDRPGGTDAVRYASVNAATEGWILAIVVALTCRDHPGLRVRSVAAVAVPPRRTSIPCDTVLTPGVERCSRCNSAPLLFTAPVHGGSLQPLFWDRAYALPASTGSYPDLVTSFVLPEATARGMAMMSGHDRRQELWLVLARCWWRLRQVYQARTALRAGS